MRTPRILVTDGWITDQNGSLTEVVIPSSVKTLQAPTKVTFEGTTLNAVPSTAAALQEFSAPNCTTATSTALFSGYSYLSSVYLPNLLSVCTPNSSTNNNFFKNCSSLTHVSLPKVTSLYSYNACGTFYGCSNLVSVDLPSVTYITSTGASGGGYAYGGTFYNCTSLTTVNLPACTQLNSGYSTFGYGSPFYNCSALITINLPLLTSCTGNYGCFRGCSALQSITLGSPGHAVISLNVSTFSSLTQSGLTITIYTNGGASLANEPWGATNATIVYEEA